MKKSFGFILCMMLAVALMVVGAFADSSPSPGKRGDRRGAPGSKDGAMVLSQIKEKINALEDDETQANLTKLLQAYEDALAAEKTTLEAASSATQDALDTQRKATADARSALASAFSKAGINLDSRLSDEINNSRQNDGNRGGRNGFAFQTLDTEMVEKLIANVEENKRADLNELLAAYKDALAAEKTGISNTVLTEDEKKALQETVNVKAEKLTDALTNAGIKKSDYTHRKNNVDGSAPETPPEQTENTASISDSSASGTAKVGFVQGLIKWLGGWLK